MQIYWRHLLLLAVPVLVESDAADQPAVAAVLVAVVVYSVVVILAHPYT